MKIDTGVRIEFLKFLEYNRMLFNEYIEKQCALSTAFKIRRDAYEFELYVFNEETFDEMQYSIRIYKERNKIYESPYSRNSIEELFQEFFL